MLLAKWAEAYDDSKAKSMIDERSSNKSLQALPFSQIPLTHQGLPFIFTPQHGHQAASRPCRPDPAPCREEIFSKEIRVVLDG
jgi:hypothetical protein